MQHNTIQLAVIDMAGTTVADDGLVVEAFEAAATAAGLPDEGPDRQRARQYVLDTMGQSKIVVFRALFRDEGLAQRANAAFEDAYAALIADGVGEGEADDLIGTLLLLLSPGGGFITGQTIYVDGGRTLV